MLKFDLSETKYSWKQNLFRLDCLIFGEIENKKPFTLIFIYLWFNEGNCHKENIMSKLLITCFLHLLPVASLLV